MCQLATLQLVRHCFREHFSQRWVDERSWRGGEPNWLPERVPELRYGRHKLQGGFRRLPLLLHMLEPIQVPSTGHLSLCQWQLSPRLVSRWGQAQLTCLPVERINIILPGLNGPFTQENSDDRSVYVNVKKTKTVDGTEFMLSYPEVKMWKKLSNSKGKKLQFLRFFSLQVDICEEGKRSGFPISGDCLQEYLNCTYDHGSDRNLWRGESCPSGAEFSSSLDNCSPTFCKLNCTVDPIGCDCVDDLGQNWSVREGENNIFCQDSQFLIMIYEKYLDSIGSLFIKKNK